MMKRWAAVLGGCLALATVGAAAAGVKIATYNVENYVATNRLTEAGYRKDYPKAEAAKAALRTVIRELDADVLVLQEMGPRPYLDELQRDLATQGTAYPVAVLLEAADPDRHLAVLARVQLARVRPHVDLRFRYFDGTEQVKRGLLEVVLASPAGDVTLWAVHLKSRYTDREDDLLSNRRRAGEAMAIREFIRQQGRDRAGERFLILGDFNDGKGSAAVRYLSRRGAQTTAHLLPAADSRGEVWTHFYHQNDTYTRVDHILVSPALRPAMREETARIHDSPAVLEASDHRPVSVMLDCEVTRLDG
ncbi:MAG: endonuclease/exonuclease/phosphatase family protein [Opitutales bacterium]